MKKLKSIFLIGGTFSLAMKIYYDEICYRIGREGLMETYDSPNLDLMETPLDQLINNLFTAINRIIRYKHYESLSHKFVKLHLIPMIDGSKRILLDPGFLEEIKHGQITLNEQQFRIIKSFSLELKERNKSLLEQLLEQQKQMNITGMPGIGQKEKQNIQTLFVYNTINLTLLLKAESPLLVEEILQKAKLIVQRHHYLMMLQLL